MQRPDLVAVKAYIVSAGVKPKDDEVITHALAAEAQAQAHRCTVPTDDEDWPADLVEALCRRVLVNLTLRTKPLGVEAAISEVGVGFARVGGSDPEVRRLEAPYRRLVVG